MKKQNPPSTKAHVVRGTLYLLLLLSAFVIRLALGQQSAINSGVDPAKMSLAGRISSMSETAEAQPSNTPNPAATAVVVWDQYNNAGTAVTLSASFTDSPAMNSDLADDFEVQGYAWMVRWIDVDAAYFNGPGPANSFTVFFYADNDGFPGNQVYATFAWWEQNGSTFRVHVCDNPPCQPILYPGRYWVEIQANMTAKCCGEWGWTDRTITNLDAAVWRNPSGFFGACTNWSRRGATCGLDPSAPDQVYRIYANLLPTPTATTTPAASPSASEAQCTVIGSQPPCNSTVFTQVTDFVVYIDAPVEAVTVKPSDFTVNGTPADDDGVFGASITFHFNASPVVQGQNTMHIPAGAFICEGSGHYVNEFTCAFTYQPSTPTPTQPPPSPTATATPTATPTLTPRPSPTPRVAPTPRVRPTPPPRP